MTDFRSQPELYSRFLVDIFLILCGTRDELTEYQDYLNSLMPGIKVTLCIKNTVTEFLDTLVYKKNYRCRRIRAVYTSVF